eukprot:scaffold4590_cov389-Prasinococcus_capsulatus_cf.AAC.2
MLTAAVRVRREPRAPRGWRGSGAGPRAPALLPGRTPLKSRHRPTPAGDGAGLGRIRARACILCISSNAPPPPIPRGRPLIDGGGCHGTATCPRRVGRRPQDPVGGGSALAEGPSGLRLRGPVTRARAGVSLQQPGPRGLVPAGRRPSE